MFRRCVWRVGAYWQPPGNPYISSGFLVPDFSRHLFRRYMTSGGNLTALAGTGIIRWVDLIRLLDKHMISCRMHSIGGLAPEKMLIRSGYQKSTGKAW